MKKKDFLCILLAAVLLGSLMTASASGSKPVHLVVNGEGIVFTDSTGYPFIDENNRTLVPLRAAADAMGLEVAWDGETRTATFSREWTLEDAPVSWDRSGDGEAESYPARRVVSFRPGEKTYQVDVSVDYEWNTKYGGVEKQTTGGISGVMDTAPVIRNNRIYAPIRYLAEAFYWDVTWDGAARTVGVAPYQQCDYRYYNCEDDPTLFYMEDWGNLASVRVTKITQTINGGAPRKVAFTVLDVETAADPCIWGEHPLILAVKADFDLAKDSNTEVEATLKLTKANGAELTRTVRLYWNYVPEAD